MRVLILGGAGYIGSACFRALRARNHDVVAFDDLSEGNAESIPQGSLARGDILDRDALREVMREHETELVLHCAGLAAVSTSIVAPEEYWRINLLGTKSVLDAMTQATVDRILFSSTAATYASGLSVPITEDARQIPQTPYGATKLAAEWLIRDYARARGLGYGILRYFNASGASVDGQHGESRRVETHLIPTILLSVLGKRPTPRIFGRDWDTHDGTCVRDFVHIEDLAEAHRLLLESISPSVATVYNVGSGHGTTVLQVLDACERVVGEPISHEFVPRRPGDPAMLVADASKLRRELGWRPQHDIDSIVATAWRWHRAHPAGYVAAGARNKSEARPQTNRAAPSRTQAPGV